MFKKVKNLINILFSKPHDISTEVGRAKERARRIALTSATGIIAKIISVLTGIITVPITLPYLGIEQFGIWVFLTGFIALLAFADLGLSIGLKSVLARCYGENNRISATQYISSAFFLLLLITSVIILIASVFIINVPLDFLLEVQQPSQYVVLKNTAFFLVIVFALGMPSAVVHRALEAYQLGFIANIALSIGRIFALCSVFLCVNFEASLTIMATCYLALPLATMYILGLWFANKYAWVRPSLRNISKSNMLELFSIGKLALRAQLGASIMASGPLMVLTSVFGAAAITPYALTKRMFDAVTMLMSELLAPLWPAYGEAYVRNDYTWIVVTFRKSILLSITVFTPVFLLLSFFGQKVILVWSQESAAVPSFELLMVCNIWIFLLLIIRILSVFLNGINAFKGQSRYGLFLPIIAMVFGWFIAQTSSLVISLMVIIVIGEFMRIIFMSIECKKYLRQFKFEMNKVKP
ncbi:MAG: hypothetical protein OCD00_13050 [Colwellia sp.]